LGKHSNPVQVPGVQVCVYFVWRTKFIWKIKNFSGFFFCFLFI